MADFDFRTMTADEAAERRRQLRTGQGGRRSKYSPVGDQLTNMKEGQILSFSVAPNQIISLRNYMTRNFGDKYRVTSRRLSDESYEVHVGPNTGGAPKRGRRKKANG